MNPQNKRETPKGAKTFPCAKCGKVKIGSINRTINPELDSSLLKMVLMSYGKYRGSYICKNCRED